MTQINETAWTDAAGTHHIVTLEVRGSGYVVRHVLNLGSGSSALGEESFDILDDARQAFTKEVGR